MVDDVGARRQQQQKEEAVQLVVCGWWRPMRLESSSRLLVIQDSVDPREAKVFERTERRKDCATI